MDLYTSNYLRSIHLIKDSVPSFQKHPFNIPSIRKLTELSFHENITFIVGENGMGKSTLLGFKF